MEKNLNPPKIGDILKYDFSFSDEQVRMYAEISGDINPIHISREYAESTNFGRCIVHGYFTTSIFSKVHGTELYPDEAYSYKSVCKIY